MLILIWGSLGLIGLIIYYFRWWKQMGCSPDIDNWKQFIFVVFACILFGPITFYGAITKKDIF